MRITYSFKKRALAALDFIVAAGIIAAIILLVTLLDRVNEQIELTKQQVIDTHNDLQTATKTLEGDMACIGAFFSMKDRANLRIDNLRDCHVINDSTGDGHNLPLERFIPANPSENRSAQNTTPQPAPAKPAPAAPAPDNRNGLQKTLDTAGGIVRGVVDFINPFN